MLGLYHQLARFQLHAFGCAFIGVQSIWTYGGRASVYVQSPHRTHIRLCIAS